MSTAPIAPAGPRPAAPPPPERPALPEAPPATTTPRRSPFHVSRGVWSLVVSAVIVLWQLDFNVNIPAPQAGYVIESSTGLLRDIRYFFYFYYHFGLFPVGAREVRLLGPSRQDALSFVARQGDKLRMDFGESRNTPRHGDYGKLFTLWPDVWLRGDPAHPSAKAFNELLFIAALVAVWWAFWRERRPLLGALVVLLVGSNPFQLFETYNRANIFSLPISVAMLALAAHVPYLSGRRGLDRRAWLTALGSGIALATIREIRTEAAIIGLALMATYLTLRGPWPRRLALVLVFVAAAGVTSQAWTAYWKRGFDRAAQFVERAGGTVFPGRHGSNHAFWHAVWCGLGDFGRDRGFVWDDRAAFRWATTRDPVTNPNPLPYHYRRGYYFEETYDGIHPIAPPDLPAYNQLMRDRVLGAVRADPPWYLGILARRAGAILEQATPVALTVGVASLQRAIGGWLMIPVLLLVGLLRRTFETKLILFMLPLSAVALLIYSGRGTTSYGIAHLIALAVAIDLLVRASRSRAAERRADV